MKEIRNKLKYLYIDIEVGDACNTHNHRVLHITLANNISFAVNKYVATFYGPGKRPNKDEWWYWFNELSGRLVKYKELSAEEYSKLNELFYEQDLFNNI